MQYTVKTTVFEGPFDLLLSLIEERKLLVSDISLASVTDDFIKHVNDNKGIAIGVTAHFILVASTLLLIKSKSLLPVLSFTPDEAGDVRDLERRLQLYEKFRKYTAHIRIAFGAVVLYQREESKVQQVPIFSPSKDLSVQTLRDAAGRVLASFPKEEKIPEKSVQKVMSLEEMMGTLSERISKALQMSFSDFAGVGKREKVNVIISFLAMLELVKQGALSVIQHDHFSDIEMTSDHVGAPKY